jgi:hypothetical protein
VAKSVIVLIVFLFVLAVAVAYLFAKYTDQAEVVRARDEKERLTTQRDSILSVAAAKDSLVAVLQERAGSLEQSVDSLLSHQAALEAGRVDVETANWRVFNDDSIMTKMSTRWPEYKRSFRFRDIQDPGTGVELRYLLCPWGFTTEILNNANDARSFKQQTGALHEVVDLQDSVIHLEKRIAGLEREKAEAFRTGYDSAYVLYTKLNDKYVKLLENPRIEMGFPGWLPVAGGVALGLVGGAAVGGAIK